MYSNINSKIVNNCLKFDAHSILLAFKVSRIKWFWNETYLLNVYNFAKIQIRPFECFMSLVMFYQILYSVVSNVWITWRSLKNKQMFHFRSKWNTFIRRNETFGMLNPCKQKRKTKYPTYNINVWHAWYLISRLS